jgi:hypothetical protein
MKIFLYLVLIGLAISGSDVSAGDTHSARMERALKDVSLGLNVQSVTMMFPMGTNLDGTAYERVDRGDYQDFVIKVSGDRNFFDILGAVLTRHAVKCDDSAPDGFAVLRIEYKNQRVEDYLISDRLLQSRNDGRCFRQSRWIQRAVALWP